MFQYMSGDIQVSGMKFHKNGLSEQKYSMMLKSFSRRKNNCQKI